MIRSSRARWWTSILLTLLLCAPAVTPAFADDGVPPTETTAPAEESAPLPEEPVIELPVEALPVEAPAELPVSEPAPAPAEELLAEVPEGTTVAVIGEAGEVLPLASAEAAEVLATGDPIWCPTGVLPGGAACSDPFLSLTALVAGFIPTANGVIWIEAGTDSSAIQVTIDGGPGGNWESAASFALTLQGGWTGTGGGVEVTTPTTFTARLDITRWNAAITLNDIVIDGAVGQGLDIDTTGKVTLNRVVADGNGAGVRIDNTAGSADVVVNASQFINSLNGTGLSVVSNGQITLSDVIADSNSTHGVILDNDTAATAKNIILTSGKLEFTENGNYGLWVFSKGSILLKDVSCTGNGSYGASLYNALGSGRVSLTGVNVFSENGTNGLYVGTKGSITASNLIANANGPFNFGADLNNTYAPTAQPVTLTGTNEFKFNGSGLRVRSNGMISISNLTANYNLFTHGVELQNDYPGFAGDVKVTGFLNARRNSFDGVLISSNGAITLANVTADANGQDGDGDGAHLDNTGATSPKPVTLTGTNFISDNSNNGLMVFSRGAVTISNLTAQENYLGQGAYIDTQVVDGLPQKVTLTGTNIFNENGAHGLLVSSWGAIAVANLTASDNGDDGAILDAYGAGAAPGPASITLTGTNQFYSNAGRGLDVRTLGAIQVSNLDARGNETEGAYLNNSYSNAVGALTVSGTSWFRSNDGAGLVALSRGNITLQDWQTYANEGQGAVLDNAVPGSAGNVTAGTSRANWCNEQWGNTLSGLEIYSFGVVTLSNLCAMENGDAEGDGVHVENNLALKPKAVNLKGASSFDDNYSRGLYVLSIGPISGSNLEASGNMHGEGVYLINTDAGPAAPQNVTLTGTNEFSGNSADGLIVHTYGAVTLSNLVADDNGGDGIHVNNASGAATPKPVTLNGYANASGNGSAGLEVISLGAIKTGSLEATENGTYGASLGNSYLGASGGIALGGAYSQFNGNASYGLLVDTLGPIAINVSGGLNAAENGGWGVKLDNSIGAGAITLGAGGLWGSSFYGNGEDGLIVRSTGAITLSDISADWNDGVGALISNTDSGPGAPQNVTLNVAAAFDNNLEHGLYVTSYGAITTSNLYAVDNGRAVGVGYTGVTLDNYLTDNLHAPKPITLNGNNEFHSNSGGGLSVRSLGLIKAGNLIAGWNGYEDDAAGAYLDNQWGQPLAAAVTLTGSQSLEDNYADGLLVFTHGAITISNLFAKGNNGVGAYLEADGLTTPAKVTLTGSNTFDDNGDHFLDIGEGLEILADGQITLSNLYVITSAANGAILDNATLAGSVPAGITLSGTNMFWLNGDDGLYFRSLGPVSLSRVTADYNGDDGVDGYSAGTISFSCGGMTYNNGYGWHLGTPVSLTLRGVWAYGNATPNTLFYGGGVVNIYRSCP